MIIWQPCIVDNRHTVLICGVPDDPGTVEKVVATILYADGDFSNYDFTYNGRFMAYKINANCEATDLTFQIMFSDGTSRNYHSVKGKDELEMES